MMKSVKRGHLAAVVLLAPLLAATGGPAGAAPDVSWHCTPSPKAPGDNSPPCGFASDDWVRSGSGAWSQEQARREAGLRSLLADTDPARAAAYGFRTQPLAGQPAHNPALAWNWFTSHPIGFGGLPHVLLQTLLSLDPNQLKPESDPDDKPLSRLAYIWRKPSPVPGEAAQRRYTLDHLGFGPHPDDYEQGVAKAPAQRSHLLPNGLVHEPEYSATNSGKAARVPSDAELDSQLKTLLNLPTLGLAFSKVSLTSRTWINDVRTDLRKSRNPGSIDYGQPRDTLQKAPPYDATFFACSACHQGRVIVGAQLSADGKLLKPGQMQFMPGMPNTEVEAQYYSRLLMETGFELLASGFGTEALGLPKSKSDLKPDTTLIKSLYRRMLQRALDPEAVKTLYGPSPEQVTRAKMQTLLVARDFPAIMGDVIGVAVKTQYIYLQIAQRNSYNPANPRRAPGQVVPDTMGNRLGQMDAFGIASGLVAIHAQRPDNTYLRFICEDSKGTSPLFELLGTKPGPTCKRGEIDAAKNRLVSTLANWAPQVPAPIDIPSLNWSGHRVLANWDGNQGAAARTLASGTSATGDPLKVNVRIHEPLNPLINNLPPSPYPFAVDREKAARGMAIFFDRKDEHLQASERCSECHRPRSAEIFPAKQVGTDPNRSLLNTDISRWGLGSLVMEACRVFMGNNPGNDWCLPHDEQGKVITDWMTAADDYFKDTPGRVRAGTNGYKADMQHGIWARAPYLHNGSVPTLGALLCPAARPAKFLRGNLYYDETLVGFEWAITPQERYSPNETMLIKTYDTAQFGRSNKGHEFGSSLCPSLDGLDPVKDRAVIAERIKASKAGDLIEYMKTF